MALLVPSWDDGLELPALLRKRQKDLFALLEDTSRIRRERQAQLAHLNKQLKQVRLEIDLEKQYQTSLHDGTRALQMAKTQQELVDVTNQFESEVNRQKSLAGQLHGAKAEMIELRRLATDGAGINVATRTNRQIEMAQRKLQRTLTAVGQADAESEELKQKIASLTYEHAQFKKQTEQLKAQIAEHRGLCEKERGAAIKAAEERDDLLRSAHVLEMDQEKRAHWWRSQHREMKSRLFQAERKCYKATSRKREELLAATNFGSSALREPACSKNGCATSSLSVEAAPGEHESIEPQVVSEFFEILRTQLGASSEVAEQELCVRFLEAEEENAAAAARLDDLRRTIDEEEAAMGAIRLEITQMEAPQSTKGLNLLREKLGAAKQEAVAALNEEQSARAILTETCSRAAQLCRELGLEVSTQKGASAEPALTQHLLALDLYLSRRD